MEVISRAPLIKSFFVFLSHILLLLSSADPPLLPAESSIIDSTSGPLTQQEEVEPRLLELEQDPPNWRELASSEVLSKLTKKETKRQEVINGK